MKGDKCVKGMKCKKHVNNITDDKCVNTVDTKKPTGCKMHEQQKCDKAYNTCNEKVITHNNKCVNGKNHGCYHHKICESQQPNNLKNRQLQQVG